MVELSNPAANPCNINTTPQLFLTDKLPQILNIIYYKYRWKKGNSMHLYSRYNGYWRKVKNGSKIKSRKVKLHSTMMNHPEKQGGCSGRNFFKQVQGHKRKLCTCSLNLMPLHDSPLHKYTPVPWYCINQEW